MIRILYGRERTKKATQETSMNPLFAGSLVQRLRLLSGLILFLFAATHFINTAFGVWSLEFMEDAQAVRLAITRSWA
jgi:adenylate cyclase